LISAWNKSTPSRSQPAALLPQVFRPVWQYDIHQTRLIVCRILPSSGLNFPKEITPMAVEWNHDIDATLARAKAENRAVLMDFSAAPA